MSRVRRQAIVTALVGVTALSLGGFVVAVLLGGFTVASLSALIPQMQTLVWAAVVSLAVPPLARDGGARLAWIAVGLAPVVGVAAALLPYGLQGGIGVVVAAWMALTLTAAAAVGAIAGAVDARSGAARQSVEPAASVTNEPFVDGTAQQAPGPGAPVASTRGERILSLSIIVSIVVGAAAAFALPMIWLGVYFSIWDAAPPPTAEEIARYEWAAGLTVAASVLAVVLAIIRRRTGLVVASALTLLIGLGVGFVFQVPTGRFVPEPAPVVVDDDFPVCFGTTGDCPGG